MAKKTQQERAQIYFERNSKVKELFGTSDGFNFENPTDSLSHSITLKDKTITVFTKSGKPEVLDKQEPIADQPKFLKLSVKKITEALPEMNDVEVLQGYLDFEKKTEQPRSTAIAALEARIEALTDKK